MSEKPFIYISAIRRTGSSVLSRALSLHPYSIVFQEPKLARGKFKLPGRVDASLKENNVSLAPLVQEMNGIRRRGLFWTKQKAVLFFRDKVVPEILMSYRQVGIKEIRNAGWETVFKAFPGMKVIVTARDPRDIYISLHNKKYIDGKDVKVKGGFSPENIAKDLMDEFVHQKAIMAACEHIKVRYEDFCTDPGLFEEVKRFTGNEIPGVGEIGRMNPHHRKVHEGKITDKRIRRWANEQNPDIAMDAQRVFDLLPEYASFWGYDREKGSLPT
ncbi:MAG: sulfotransferase [Thermodesulfovibrionales bacterium]|nr:sulfotransferase [Thermodesulfovibrionales bacterium]